MAIDYTKLRRQFNAARNDQRRGDQDGLESFYEDIRDGLREKHLKPQDFSIRELFESLVPDGASIVKSWNPRNQGNQASLSAYNQRSPLLEDGAVMSSAFSNITGQIVYSTVLAAYQDPAFVFTPLVTNVPTQFNGEKIPGVTRLGDTFESIGEGQPYPLAGIGEDWIETPQTVKRGEIVPITKEAVFFDRTGVILQRASEAGFFYGFNKEKRIIDAIIDENVTTHRYKWKGTVYATYQASTPWINLQGTNALADWTDIDALELLFDNMVDPHTGEPIMIMGQDLICTRQIKNTAKRILNATEVRKGDGASATEIVISASPLDTSYTIRSSALLAQRMATDTSWYIGDIGGAVHYMENWALTAVEAPANSEAEFTHDIVNRWKVSERGAAVVVEPRKLAKATVA